MANGGRYYHAEEFATKEEIIQACENDFAENQKGTSGCVTFIAITLLGLASLAGTLIVSIKWA